MGVWYTKSRLCKQFVTQQDIHFGRADLVRRAMGKKKLDVMAKEREVFINGQVDENGNIIVPRMCKKWNR